MRIKLILLSLLFIVSCSKELVDDINSNNVYGDGITMNIKLDIPGTLYEYIPEPDMFNISSLTLSGEINGSDLLLIKKMAGADEYANPTTGKLKYLNMADVQIVSGGDAVCIDGDNYFYADKDDYLPTGLFNCCTQLKEVILPENCNFRGSHTFNECNSLEKIVLPYNISYIPKYTFYQCSSLTDANLSSTITVVGDYAFANCIKLSSFDNMINLKSYGVGSFTATSIKKFKFSENNDAIPEKAFKYCKNLQIEELPENLKTIGNGAFEGCTNIKKLDFSKYANLESIGKDAFNKSGLECEIDLPPSLKYLGYRAFWDTDVTKLIINSNIKSDVPDDLNYASDYSPFRSCHRLQKVIISEGVTHLEIGAAVCSNLSEIIMPSTLKYIGTKDITSLFFASFSVLSTNDIIFPDNISYIAPWSFSCANLNKVELPAKLLVLEEYSFSTSFIKNIKLNNGLKTIGLRSLQNNNFKTLTIPETVEIIESGAFAGCNELVNIKFPDSIKQLGTSVCEECTSLKSVIFPCWVSYIPDCMFLKCESLKEIQLHQNIIEIGMSAFQNCNSLTELILPSSLQSIEDYAISYCPKLNYIEIPISVSKIGEYAFSHTDIKSFKVNWTSPIEVPQNIFEGVNLSNATLYVPNGCKVSYESIRPWSLFENIYEM